MVRAPSTHGFCVMRSEVLAAVLLALVLAVPLADVAVAQQAEAPRGLTLVGVGEVRARPDMAVVRLGVVSQAATARAALDDNNRDMQAILDALRDQGVAARDVQTSSFTVQPRYRHDRNGEQPPRIDGYEVSNEVAVRVRDLDRLGAVLDQAVSVGSNRVLGVAFTLSDPEPRRDEARRIAVEDAIRKARVYTQAAGLDLGPIRSMSELDRSGPPEPVFRQMEMAADASVPIAEGEQVIEVEVTINWDIR
jgi:uncharacterized protein